MAAKYSEGLKEEALALAQETSVSSASGKLGVSTKIIYDWRQQKRLSEAPTAVSGNMEAQNRQLRREIEELRQANTRLRKALGFLRRDSGDTAMRGVRVDLGTSRENEREAVLRSATCWAAGLFTGGFGQESRLVTAMPCYPNCRKYARDTNTSVFGSRSGMRAMGRCTAYGKIHELMSKRKPCGITKRDKNAKLANDLVQRDFHADKPTTKLLNDMTEIKCEDGKLYLAATLDCFDGAIVGMKMDENKRAEMCKQSLESAVQRYGKTRDVIVHSDHGSQYTSNLFGGRYTTFKQAWARWAAVMITREWSRPEHRAHVLSAGKDRR